jgi:DNA invertase Pin-like site-specific DNA recombinase
MTAVVPTRPTVAAPARVTASRKRRPAQPATRTAAIGYARVSTDEQAREGVSLEAQRERIEAYATAKGLALADVLVDAGTSGKDLRRPALQELLDRCQRGDVAHVVVLKLDRLTRRTRDLLALVESVFLAKGIELHSVSESLDTSTPHGRFTLTLLGSLGQLEREVLAERTRGALAFKRENGQPTSHPPLGFRPNGSKRHRMIPVASELVTVQRILDAHAAGESYAGIAAALNAEGAATKRGGRGRWYASTVRNVVQRRAWYAAILSGREPASLHVRSHV